MIFVRFSFCNRVSARLTDLCFPSLKTDFLALTRQQTPTNLRSRPTQAVLFACQHPSKTGLLHGMKPPFLETTRTAMSASRLLSTVVVLLAMTPRRTDSRGKTALRVSIRCLLFDQHCLWSPYIIGQTIIFLPCDFYLLSFFSFLA